MNKQKIAIDIDDVLAANAEGFVAYSNEKWGTNLRVEDYDEHWAEVWKVDMAETERRAVELHDSGIIAAYKHFNEALPILKKLSDRFDLIAITSRRRSIERLTREWIAKHYAGVFMDVQFAGIFDEPVHHEMLKKTKVDLFTSNNVSYVIDDQLKHCLAAAALGIDTILFGNYAWNQAAALPANITRCHDWAAVDEYFDARSS